jgi:hypothetical protein
MLHIELLPEKLKLFEELFSSANAHEVSSAFKAANDLTLLERRFLKYHLNRVQKEWNYKMNKAAHLIRERI